MKVLVLVLVLLIKVPLQQVEAVVVSIILPQRVESMY